MIIGSSYMNMESKRSFTSETKQSVTFLVEQANGGDNRGNKGVFKELLKSGMDEEATAQMEDSMLGLRQGKRDVSSISRSTTPDDGASIRAIKAKCIFFLMRFLFSTKNKESDISVNSATEATLGTGTTQFQDSNLSMAAYHSESEQTTYHSSGTVVTADGRQISFGLELQMSRSFSEYYEENYQTIDNTQLMDPLVINLDSNIAQLSDQKFFFDLDADGTKESISTLNSGSGYLALDKNHDGKINDGSELFGTKSGDGFAELAKYDDDGNGWIDENDDIWSKLQIWTKGEDGSDMLYRLSDKGIGAICLQNVDTQYSLNSLRNNETNGVIRSTGVFLYENGNVGTVQHLDVAT